MRIGSGTTRTSRGSDLIEELVKLALRIRERALSYVGLDSEEERKSFGGDTVRAVDEAAEEVLSSWAKGGKRPTVISEESGVLKGELPGFVIVDPVDGSANADRGIPFASVSIAYTRDGTLSGTVYGIILDIFRGDLYLADEGGVRYNGKAVSVREFRGTPVIYSPCEGSNVSLKELLGVKKVARRDLGSVALGLALVSRGVMDGVIDLRDDLRGVDIAAGLYLVKRAGGRVALNFDNFVERAFTRSISLVASSPGIFERLNLKELGLREF